MATGLPNIIIAGVAKAGTTSLYQYLAQHDEICPSDVKELNYFTSVAEPDGETRPPVETYMRHFQACGEQIYRMEASPSYFYGGQQVIDAIREVLGRPRILISLRDPVRRFWSAYTFLQSMGRLDPNLTIDQYLDQCLIRGSVTDDPTPLSVGRYIDWLARWVDAFGADLHILFAEELFASPSDVVDGVLNWLGLKPGLELDVSPHNRTAVPHSRRLAKVAYEARRMSDRLLASTPRGRALLRSAYRRLNTGELEKTLPEDVRGRLTEYYAASTRDLGRLLARHDVVEPPAWVAEAS